MYFSNSRLQIFGAGLLILALTGCAGALIETTTDAALAVAKAPFKAGGAIVDVVTGDDDD